MVEQLVQELIESIVSDRSSLSPTENNRVERLDSDTAPFPPLPISIGFLLVSGDCKSASCNEASLVEVWTISAHEAVPAKVHFSFHLPKLHASLAL